MEFFQTITQKRSVFLSIALVTLFSFIFSGLAIYSASEQDKGIKILVKHPFAVSAAIYNVRKGLFEMQVYMGRLEMYHTPKDVAIVKNRIAQTAESITRDLSYIVNYYLGPTEQALFVKDSVEKAYKIQQDLLQQENINPNDPFFKEKSTQLSVIYEKIDEMFTNKMLKFTESKGKHLSKQSSNVLIFTIFMSFCVWVLMIAGAILWQRVSVARQKEKEHRDYLFKVISENADTVFMLYDIHHKNMNYISPNVAQMVGPECATVENNPMILRQCCATSEAICFDLLFGSEILKKPFSEEVLFENAMLNEKQWGLVNIYPVAEAGTITQYLVSISNLTKVKKAQQALKDALVSAEIAQNASKAKSQFFSRMSHDIRTPMNAIIGMTTIAASALDDRARIEDCLSKIAASSRHLLMLINDVLDMAKIESGKFTLATTAFSLVDFIKNITTLIYPQASAKKIQFELTMDEIHHEILRGDPLRLNQVLLNILSNALKFTPEGGEITLHIQQVTDKSDKKVCLHFTISDTGIGMSPEFLQRLFVPFEQEHTLADSSIGGTGLGMAIVKNIVTLMGGDIQVESTKGKGTTFRLSMHFEGETPVKYQAVELDDLNVLVVDDDRGTCEHVALILQKLGVRSGWVLSGKEAVERIFTAQDQSDAFNVVFIDWRMPEMDGLEVIRRIRKQIGKDTLIIIISAYDWSEIEQEARIAGANAFIAKPMFPSTLYNTLLSAAKGIIVETAINAIPDFSGKHFLLAEDNAINAEIAVELLKPTGATLDVVKHGKEAVELFAQSPSGTYAAVLMDVQMPVMDGYQATENIRALDHPDAISIPIIAMTANAFADDVEDALRAGMNDHISKPIDTRVMFRKLEEWLQQRGA